MSRIPKRRATRIVSALLVSTGALGLGTLISAGAAHADPPYANTSGNSIDLVGVGSNTIEDLLNAYSGEEPTAGISGVVPKFYTPVADPTTGERLYSFDAENPYQPTNTTTVGCITTKLGGPAFDRPNGSGNGRKALSDALEGQNWWEAGPPSGCVGASPGTPVAGQIDFSRASSAPSSSSLVTPSTANCGPSGTLGPCITNIAFARDGVSYAYDLGTGVSVSSINQLTDAQLETLYTSSNGQLTVGSTTVYACLPQTGSGTVGFFETAIGLSGSGGLSSMQAAATANNCYGIEENSGNDFVGHLNGGAAPAANTAWITPFSIGSWIAQFNGAAQDNTASARADGVDLADVNATPEGSSDGANLQPYITTSGVESADPVFEASTNWGRNLFLVVPWYKIDGGIGAKSSVYANIFGTATATSYPSPSVAGSICSANALATDKTFGFLDLSQVSGAPVCGTQYTTAPTPGNG